MFKHFKILEHFDTLLRNNIPLQEMIQTSSSLKLDRERTESNWKTFFFHRKKTKTELQFKQRKDHEREREIERDRENERG